MVLEAKEKCKIKSHSNTHHEFLHKQPGKVLQMTISFLSANGKEAATIKKNGGAETILSLCPQCQVEPRRCANHEAQVCSGRRGLVLEIHCSSSIITEGLGFKEERTHGQGMAPQMGCGMKLEAGSRRDLIFNSIENVRSCVF